VAGGRLIAVIAAPPRCTAMSFSAWRRAWACARSAVRLARVFDRIANRAADRPLHRVRVPAALRLVDRALRRLAAEAWGGRWCDQPHPVSDSNYYPGPGAKGRPSSADPPWVGIHAGSPADQLAIGGGARTAATRDRESRWRTSMAIVRFATARMPRS